MKDPLIKSDEITRREFVANAAKTCLGVGLGPMIGSALTSHAFAKGNGIKEPASAVIFLNMSGGMSHIDTFDIKPNKKAIQGPVKAINTKLDGLQISHYLPKTAAVMDKVCLIRSMTSENGAHERGQYMLHRSYAPRSTITHPSLGAWAMKLRGSYNQEIPGFVTIGGSGKEASAGFFGAKYAGIPIANAKDGLKNSTRPKSVNEDDFNRRLKLSDALNQGFHQKHQNTQAKDYDELYKEAISLMNSDDLKAFDINLEPKSSRSAYGDTPFGQGCLLARRLVEHGVRFVEVTLGGWDTHYDNFTGVEARCNQLDQAYANLLIELEAKGLLSSTLVVLTTEFGRSPEIQAGHKNGRDHHPSAYSSLLAGGGAKAGMVYGRTDSKGNRVKDDKVTVLDFNATIAHQLGLDLNTIQHSASGRPFKVASKGKPVKQLIS